MFVGAGPANLAAALHLKNEIKKHDELVDKGYKSGKKIEQIDVAEPWTANVCFGGKDRQTLLITASKSLYGVRLRVKGVGSQ